MINNRPVTRKQWEVRARMAAITAGQRFGLGIPMRRTPKGARSEDRKEALLEIILNESPHLNLDQLRALQKECSHLGPIYRNIEGFPDFTKHEGILLNKMQDKLCKYRDFTK